MPPMSKKYCLSTSPRKMGFSQKASCKARGLLKRTSKKYKGKYVISPKYKDNGSRSLYSNINKSRSRPRTKTGYGNAKRASETLKNIKKFDKRYQMQVVNTMYNRAKFHANQTSDMREAMKVFKKWLKRSKRK
jgi:hypothetical protein